MLMLPLAESHPDLIVGLESPDDAGVFRLTDDIALIQTVDYFTPVVDDPYDFGRIAAANALSDVYAMGGRPLTAMNLVGFPVKDLPLEMLAEILRGGREKIQEAGAVLVGGHSVEDKEPKYGLAVTGIVHPERVLTKAGARPGDVLVLTKPLGIGVITTAIKGGLAEEGVIREAVEVMATLNKGAAEAMEGLTVHACTDITGFGLLGHAGEMARASGVRLRLYSERVPVLPAAEEYVKFGLAPGGTRANLEYVSSFTQFAPAITEEKRLLLADAITSGGLLVALPPAEGEKYLEKLREKGARGWLIGEVVTGEPGTIEVV